MRVMPPKGETTEKPFPEFFRWNGFSFSGLSNGQKVLESHEHRN
jgi:hypothetical protein